MTASVPRVSSVVLMSVLVVAGAGCEDSSPNRPPSRPTVVSVDRVSGGRPRHFTIGGGHATCHTLFGTTWVTAFAPREAENYDELVLKPFVLVQAPQGTNGTFTLPVDDEKLLSLQVYDHNGDLKEVALTEGSTGTVTLVKVVCKPRPELIFTIDAMLDKHEGRSQTRWRVKGGITALGE